MLLTRVRDQLCFVHGCMEQLPFVCSVKCVLNRIRKFYGPKIIMLSVSSTHYLRNMNSNTKAHLHIMKKDIHPRMQIRLICLQYVKIFFTVLNPLPSHATLLLATSISQWAKPQGAEELFVMANEAKILLPNARIASVYRRIYHENILPGL